MTEAKKKVAISKVRKSFLYKAPTSEQEEEEMKKDLQPSPTESALPKDQTMAVFTALAFAEKDRKLYLEMKYFNLFSRINTLNIKINENVKVVEIGAELYSTYNVNPWRYTVKRLESYGDLNAAVWAQRIKNYNETYEEAMERYFDLIEDELYAQELENERQKALEMRKTIEDNEEFHRGSIFLGRYTAYPISFGFSEGFLSDMGFTIEEFIVWSRQNGMCEFLDGSSTININLAKNFLAALKSNFKSMQEVVDYESLIVGVNGRKKKVILKFHTIMEPTMEGVIFNIYYIVKKDKAEEYTTMEFPINDRMSLKMVKNTTDRFEEDS